MCGCFPTPRRDAGKTERPINDSAPLVISCWTREISRVKKSWEAEAGQPVASRSKHAHNCRDNIPPAPLRHFHPIIIHPLKKCKHNPTLGSRRETRARAQTELNHCVHLLIFRFILIDIPTVWLCQHMGGQAARPGLTYLITPGLSSNIYGFSFLIHSRWCVTVPPQSASSSFLFLFFLLLSSVLLQLHQRWDRLYCWPI